MDEELQALTTGGVSLASGFGGEAGFGEDFLPRNDDGSSVEIDITPIFEDGINFFGREFDTLWVNNNGSVTFNGPRGTFTPTAITEVSGNPEITPFFADVDTRSLDGEVTPGGNSAGTNLVYYAFDTVNDRMVFTWDDVGYYFSAADKLNAFQLILTDRGAGDFDIEFRYEDINWTTGDASGGTVGLGGTVARAGYTAGTGDPAAFFELPASGDQAAILALDETPGNTGDIGRWFFPVRSGDVVTANIPALPAPGTGLGGWTVGDPHLQTFDGVGYSFQAAGEYVLTREIGDGGFEVQARFVPSAESDLVSVTAAIATRMGNGTSVEIDGQSDTPLLVGGVARNIDNFSSIAVGDDRIFREDNVLTLVFAGEDGEIGAGDGRLIVDILNGRVDIDIRLDASLVGALEGLLGDGDGNAANDVALADGTVLARPFDYADLYGQYRADWRVDDASESLFTYATGEGPDTAYLPGFPSGLVTLADLDDDVREAATRAAVDAGLSFGTANFENAVLDFALTGDRSFIASSLGVPSLSDAARVDIDPDTVVDLSRLLPTIEGDDGRNRLLGTGEAELLLGRGGRDILIGGGGNDLMEGGEGRDFFVLRDNPGFVTIEDWSDGPDLLALDDQLLGLGDAGIDPRAPTLEEAFGALLSGQVAYNRGTGELRIDTDGAAGPGGFQTVAVIEGGGDLAITDVLLF